MAYRVQTNVNHYLDFQWLCELCAIVHYRFIFCQTHLIKLFLLVNSQRHTDT